MYLCAIIIGTSLALSKQEKELHMVKDCKVKLEEFQHTLYGKNSHFQKPLKNLDFSHQLFKEFYNVESSCAVIIRDDMHSENPKKFQSSNALFQEFIKRVQVMAQNDKEEERFMSMNDRGSIGIEITKLIGQLSDMEKELGEEIKRAKRQSLSPLRINLNRLSPNSSRSNSPLPGRRRKSANN